MTEESGFRCNLCGTQNSGRPNASEREVPSCARCGSTIRTRAMMYALSHELFGTAMAVSDFPRLPGIRILGISDSHDYAELLATRFEYRNTWYHQEPKFDITDVPAGERGRYDFILCSEVLEHVAPPLHAAFRNLFQMLKPTGVLIVTVPFTLAEASIERFPKLHDYGLAQLKDSLVLVNRTPGGKLEVHEDLVFHGGPGFALELRLLNERELRRNVRVAGFREMRFYSEDAPEWGIAFEKWSLPFSARRDPFSLPLSSAADWAKQWASAIQAVRTQAGDLQSAIARLQSELGARTEWGQRLDAELEAARGTVAELQSELERRTEWAQSNEKQFLERTEWALKLEREVAEHVAIANGLQRELTAAREELQRANAELEDLRHSRAVRVGKKLGLG